MDKSTQPVRLRSKRRIRVGTALLGLGLLSLIILTAYKRVLSPPRLNALEHTSQKPSLTSAFGEGRDNQSGEEKRTYEGVSFVFRHSLASDIQAETSPA